MKFAWLTTLILLTGLGSGCARIANDSYCDVARPHLFADEGVVQWLVENDRELLVEIVTHNETFSRLCE